MKLKILISLYSIKIIFLFLASSSVVTILWTLNSQFNNYKIPQNDFEKFEKSTDSIFESKDKAEKNMTLVKAEKNMTLNKAEKNMTLVKAEKNMTLNKAEKKMTLVKAEKNMTLNKAEKNMTLVKAEKNMTLNKAGKKVTWINEKCSKNFRLYTLPHLREKYDDVIIERHPNLPKFLTENIKVSSSLPDITSIRWTGTVFQESWRDSPKFLLYSAHFDTRLNSSLAIHIVALSDEIEEQGLSILKKYFCQMWFKIDEAPTIVPIHDAMILDYKKFKRNILNPYLLNCRVPEPQNGTSSFPVAVSIVKDPCFTPTNVLKITSSPIKKSKELNSSKNITVGICGKALFYYNKDFSTRLIEWIEILKNLGASKIFLYKTKSHKNIQKVLDYYEKEGIVKLITFYYPPPYDHEGTFLRLFTKTRRLPYRAIQNIYINDCLQRNKDYFDFLGVFDSDEIPILKQHHSFQELFESLKKDKNESQSESYFFKWREMFAKQYTKGSPQNSSDRSYYLRPYTRVKLNVKDRIAVEGNGKTFHDTNQVVWANPHTHFTKKFSIAPPVRMKTLPKEVAYMAHFVSFSGIDFHRFDKTMIEDETALLPLKERVVSEMNKALSILQI